MHELSKYRNVDFNNFKSYSTASRNFTRYFAINFAVSVSDTTWLHCFDEDDSTSDSQDLFRVKYYFMKSLPTPSIRIKGPKTQNSRPE